MNTRTTLFAMTGAGASYRTAAYLAQAHPGASIAIISHSRELSRQVAAYLGPSVRTCMLSLYKWLRDGAPQEADVLLIIEPPQGEIPAVFSRMREEPRDVVVLTGSPIINRCIFPMHIKEQLHEKV